MDTQALRWFQQVADGATVTEVGELYWVSQSGISRALAMAEATAEGRRVAQPHHSGSRSDQARPYAPVSSNAVESPFDHP